MKKIFCELCDCNEFAKEGGLFVCQGCGTKYSTEEARALMREVEDVSSPAEASVSTPPFEVNHQQIDNLFILAENAFKACNNQEAEDYCNKIIEIDVNCYKAWILKGKAIGWQSTYSNPRVLEGAIAMRKAVDFAPEDLKEDVAIEALVAIKGICIALQSLTKDNFSGSPTEANRDKFFEFCKICADATDYFNDVSVTIKAISFDVWKDQKKTMAEYMNLAGVAAVKFVRDKWNGIQYPNHDSWKTYLDWFGEIKNVFINSIENGEAAGEDENELITRYKNRIIALEDPMESCCYKQEWQSWSSSYVWVVDYHLSDSAKASRREEIRECRTAIFELQKKIDDKKAEEERAAAEERQKLIEEYWEKHREEKENFLNEKDQLNGKCSSVLAKITDLDKQIADLQAQENGKLPSEEQESLLRLRVKELENRKGNLGIFSGKEKKQLTEQILDLEDKIFAVSAQIQREKRIRGAEIANQVDPLIIKKNELQKELEGYNKRIAEIDAFLTRDPLEE